MVVDFLGIVYPKMRGMSIESILPSERVTTLDMTMPDTLFA